MRTAPPRATVAAVIGVLVAVSVAAQSATSAPPAQPVTVTTIVGCLVHGNPALQQRPDSATAVTSGSYVRTPTVVLPVGASVAVGKPGTTSTATSDGKPAADSYYRVTGLAGAELQPHLGHRVELQGHLLPTKADAAAGGMTDSKTTVDAAGKPKVTVQTRVDVARDLHATGIKMVSASCQ